MEITVKPIGYIHSPFTDVKDIPRDSLLGLETKATIVLDEELVEGVRDLKPGDSLLILFYFHKSFKEELIVRKRGTGPMTGVFSTRSPDRPNHLGASHVTITSIDGNEITFNGVDMLDGTPVLDLKPLQA